MKNPRDEPLSAFRQEIPYQELWPVARALAASEPGVAFLDSSSEEDGEGRFAVLGWRPARTLRWPVGARGAIDGLRKILGKPRMEPDPDCPVPYRGGYLGWIAYDIGRHVERLPDRHGPQQGVPDVVLAEYETLVVEDRRDKRLFVTGACSPKEGPSRLIARQAEFLERAQAVGEPDSHDGPAAEDVRADLEREEYERRVEKVLAYIRAGDIFQANLAQRFQARLCVPAVEAYARLRAASPAPYGGWFDLGGPQVLSISPELFLRRTEERVETRPIKGTRPRAADPAEDDRLRDELLHCEKEQAELAMIVDLLRNDLGRVARIGSVEVEEARALHRHPTVHHAVATVAAQLDPDVHAADLVAATMPGGSITGAPKIRAMEILDELEDARRGPYCGAAGWFGYDGNLALNILIRTLVVQDGGVSFHVGGGIVADSDPAREYDETLVKARALLAALQEPV
jgi:para-aminobenzoate synthetase component 1